MLDQGAMERPLKLITDITPTTPQPWTVKVLVVEKTHVRDARNSPTKFQRLVVMDSEHMRVQVTLFNESIAIYQDRLALYETYYISNASVTPVPVNYPFDGSPYQWSLNYRSLVERFVGDDRIALLEPNFMTLDVWAREYATLTSVDMLFIVLKVLGPKKINIRAGGTTFQEIIVIDRTLKPAILTCWDRFVDTEAAEIAAIVHQKPLIAGMHLKVTVYDGLSLATEAVSSFQINPVIGSAVDLRSWLSDNMTAVDQVLESPDLELLARNFGKEATSELRRLSFVHNNLNVNFLYASCRLRLLDMDQDIVRYYCSSCGAATSAVVGSVYTCNLCRKEVICTAGIRVNATAEDFTGTLPVTLYGHDAARFLCCRDESDVLNKVKDVQNPLRVLENNANDKEFTLRLKGQNYASGGLPSRKFIASFAVQSSIGPEVNRPSRRMPPADMLRLLATLETAANHGEFDINPEEREMLKRMMARQQLQGNLPQTSASSMHAGELKVAASETIEADVETNVSLEINTLAKNVEPDLTVPLVDEDEWQLLMQGSSEARNIQSLSSVKKSHSSSDGGKTIDTGSAEVALKEEGKNRAVDINEKSPKALRKLF